MKKMPKLKLTKYIKDFLKREKMMVLATCNDNIPRATPMDYYANGFVLYVYPGAGKKIKNIQANKIVSIGIFAPFEKSRVQGIQISSKKIYFIEKGKKGYTEAERTYRRKNKDVYLKIIPEKIEVIDFSFRKEGFDIRQTLIL